MKTTKKLLAGAVAVAIGGLAMTNIASATTTVTLLEGETVNYTLNGGEPFSAGVLQIDDEETKIFILDRNLGATAAGTGCEDLERHYGEELICPANDPTYGYHFQWGNNYGFDPNSTPETGIQLTSLSTTYSPFYTNPVFIVGSENWYNDNSRVDLWGGSTSDYIDIVEGDNWKVDLETVTNRQGPCPKDFHVPSQGEILKIMDMIGNDYTRTRNELLIPFAGNRNYYNDAAAEVQYLGFSAGLWSSSPYGSVSNDSQYFYLSSYETMWVEPDSRAYGHSVRCVHDFYDTYTKAGGSSSEGGDGSGQVTLTLTEGQNSCTLQDYNLGSHAVSQLDQNVQSSGQAIVCEFLENSRSVVSISMGDLLDGEKEIGAGNFTGVVTQGTYLGSIGNLTGGSYNLSGTHQIYEKEVNTIGIWTGELQIEGIIPAGTPSGTYTGSLEITIQAGA